MKKRSKNFIKNVLTQCKIVFLFSFLLLTASCSNYMVSQGRFFSLFRDKRFKEAAETIQKEAEKKGRDQILFLLDRGTALFEAEDYKGAIEVFTKAERLTELKDYTSISEEVISVVSTDKYKQFRPLDFERILINVYLAMSYTMLGKNESALVECRRINNLVYKLKTSGMKDFEEIAFAWYLAATLYEMEHKYNDALVDYKRVQKLMPNLNNIDADVDRMTKRLRGYKNYDNCENCGELVVIFSVGLIPVKKTDPNNKMLPKFYSRGASTKQLEVFNFDNTLLTKSFKVLDLEDVAIKNLESRKAKIIAKNLLGIGAKVGIGYGVAKATKNDSLGVLAGLLLHSTSEPDLRSWSTLPKDIQVARSIMTEGEHQVTLKYYNTDIDKKVTIKKGSVSFLVLRDF